MRYRHYVSFRESIADIIRKSKGLPKTSKTKEFMEDAIRETMHMSHVAHTLETGICIDEEDYVNSNCRIYFPADSTLLSLLWKAKMDTLPSDVTFPRCFSVAFPDDFEVDGVKPVGCIVWWGTKAERRRLQVEFGKKYLSGFEIEPPDGGDESLMLSISYHDRDVNGDMTSYRLVMPEDDIAECMKSADKMIESVGDLKCFHTMKLSEQETKRQYVMAKIVVHLMVYATACPEAVVAGWPDKYREADVGKGWIRKYTPIKIAAPRMREGVSPSMHWRAWHFRRYPLKTDGTRQSGIVFVSGCLVGGKVDPQTVIEVCGKIR